MSCSSDGVLWVPCVGEAELQELSRTTSPALGFGTEAVDCGLEGKAVCLRAKGGRVSETRVWLVVRGMRSLQMLLYLGS